MHEALHMHTYMHTYSYIHIPLKQSRTKHYTTYTCTYLYKSLLYPLMDRVFSLSRCCSYVLFKYTYTYTHRLFCICPLFVVFAGSDLSWLLSLLFSTNRSPSLLLNTHDTLHITHTHTHTQRHTHLKKTFQPFWGFRRVCCSGVDNPAHASFYIF